ncbi:hypothetical protein NQ317_010831 [Molorchus minor]|uniref:peptidylamidoglycolate lyase n=1 Tax=Molorchus minor TaxID=1323400 RepID=A0ABQ9JKV6_9CUCU|nr:hypothetical protein NQ317_010831 [Molorchus minor]
MRVWETCYRFQIQSAMVIAAGVFSLALFFGALNALPPGFDDRGQNGAIYDEVRQLASLNPGLTQNESPETSYQNASLEPSTEDPIEKPDDKYLESLSNTALQPVVFHRADRVWDQNTFNITAHYQQAHLGPIRDHTVLILDPQDGKILGRWGADLFYVPHGLTVDRHDNLWLTDVALHQAFKFKPGELEPSLTFGRRFSPGSDIKHLCMPTSVAVATTGEIFIADGYCNSRILKYNAAGGLLRIIPNPPEFLSLQIPHSLALIESMDRLCVADRENKRVTCPRAGLYSIQGRKEPALTIQQPDMGRVFGVTAKVLEKFPDIHSRRRGIRPRMFLLIENYPESKTREIFYQQKHEWKPRKKLSGINSAAWEIRKAGVCREWPYLPLLSVQGLTIDPQTESVIDHWAPEEGFGNPHDIAVCPNGSALYVVEIGPNRIWKFELVPPKK